MLKEWVEGYIRAWNSNDPEDIGALFTEDALYYTEPYAAPWRGREQIIERWLERKDEPGQTSFDWRPLVETSETAVIVGTATYRDPPRVYSNLWVLRFDREGRCLEFTEWWMEHPAPA
jgi:uncharacterized protein (TIGR02246 family)